METVAPSAHSRPSVLRLEMGAGYRPKAAGTLGDDSHFLSPDSQGFGVADGVGGWSLRHVDAGEFARQLMYHSMTAMEKYSARRSSPGFLPAILKSALMQTTAPGTSPACLGAVDGDVLRVSNIGDSAVALVRDGATEFRFSQRQKEFNFPYQIGLKTPADPVEVAENTSVRLLPGDVVVAGTDGLFDNLRGREIATLVTVLLKEKISAKEIAGALTMVAAAAAHDRTRDTPFAIASRAAGGHHRGGKIDDITVVVLKVDGDMTEDGSSPGMDEDDAVDAMDVD